MIREPKNVDFVTTGRQPSDEEFARISEWIKQDKQKQAARKPANPTPAAKVPGSREAA
ncbi:hypothetical protein [Hymenobacter ruricola]|uniref:Uncharacterized protein n=1 Tax=Hymenobacter ruricola TaxID=2791023 RepID=A0ABS0I3U0_9BACT|nr:hypothetical protein [Hymenobacter ruricola]MBF9221219.1 hypothetical protein [Hymenobacter ruricola]